MSEMGTRKQPASDVLVKLSGGLIVIALIVAGACVLTQTLGGIIFGAILGGVGFLLGLIGLVMNQFDH